MIQAAGFRNPYMYEGEAKSCHKCWPVISLLQRNVSPGMDRERERMISEDQALT